MNKFQELHALLWWLFVYLPFHLLALFACFVCGCLFSFLYIFLTYCLCFPPSTYSPERVKAASLWLPIHTIVTSGHYLQPHCLKYHPDITLLTDWA